MAILITRIIVKRTRIQILLPHDRYWELWSEAHASPVRVFEDELVDAHWLEGEAKKLRDFMLRMSKGQEKILDVPAVIEAVQDGKYYQVARVVKGPPVSPEEQDWIDEMASRIRQQVAEIQSVQQARIDALESELADKQCRIDELAATVQTQQARITVLESEADQVKAENPPSGLPAETVTEDADDLPIPPRLPSDEAEMPASEIRTERLMHLHKPQVILCYEANMDLTPDPEYLEVLSVFIEACKDGQYLDYIQAGFSRSRLRRLEVHRHRLFRAGMLERSVETFDKMRPSAAGELWYRRHTEPQEETPEQDKPPVEAGREIRTERLMHPNRAHIVLCYEANMNLAPSPKVLEVLSAFIEACQDGQYLNYSQASLPQAQVDRLYLAGMLECSAAASYKLRPSAAGELWHRRHTAPQTEAPRQEIVIDLSEVEQIRKESARIRDILLEDDADSEQDEQAQEDSFADDMDMPMREAHRPSRTGSPFLYKVHEAAVATPVEVICLSSKKMAGLCATGPYMGKLRQAIIDFKYKNAVEFAKPLAERLVMVLERRKWVFDIIVPVPLSDERLAERGYNQANLLGRQVAKQMNIPCRPGDLWRKWDTDQQTQLNAKQRVENVKNAFAAGTDVNNRSILLIDDVMATGSTLEACADALKRAGVKAVYAIAVAKTTIY